LAADLAGSSLSSSEESSESSELDCDFLAGVCFGATKERKNSHTILLLFRSRNNLRCSLRAKVKPPLKYVMVEETSPAIMNDN
jgi:hypothetical protein